MSNPNVMNPIPQKPFDKEESASKLKELIVSEKSSEKKSGVFVKKVVTT